MTFLSHNESFVIAYAAVNGTLPRAVEGEVFCGLAISSIGKPLGLVIDRIWVTTDGPGKMTMEPVR